MAQTQDQVMIKFLEVIECAICMDVIEGNRNVVTTECGHTFHCKCMMTNVAHNGFACPLCRSEMVEMPEEEEDEDAPARYEDSSDDGYDSDEEASRAEDYDGESDYGDDLEDIINYHKSAIQEETENHMLRGFRWMLQRETEDEEEDNDESDADASDSDSEDDADASDSDNEEEQAVAGALAVEVAGAVVGELETGCSISNTEQCLQHILPMLAIRQLLFEQEESSEDELEEDE
jgi:hypothetical protein